MYTIAYNVCSVLQEEGVDESYFTDTDLNPHIFATQGNVFLQLCGEEKGGREGGRKGVREGRSEEGREGGREGGRGKGMGGRQRTEERQEEDEGEEGEG